MKKKEFDVIYNLGVEFDGVGIGNVAHNAVKWGAYKHGHLKKVLCRMNKCNDIPGSKITSMPWLRYGMLPFRAMQITFKWDWICPFFYVDRVYGFLASRMVSKCDIYHGWLGYSLLGMKRAKKLGAITILECGSPHPRSDLLNEEYKKFAKSSQDEGIVKRNEIELAEADYILIPSDFVKESFIKQDFPEKKLLMVPFGVDLKKFTPKKSKNDDKFRVVFVGSIQLRKGIQYLLKAWDELNLKDAELIVVGRVWPDAHEAIKNYLNHPTIKFYGFDPDLRKYYSQSDVFVFPSIEEGSALVSYEAMASGLPVILTRNTGSVARDGKDGFVVPIRDVEILKKKIKYFYDNPKEIERMGKSARKRVENYSWEQYGKNLEKVYNEVLKKKYGSE